MKQRQHRRKQVRRWDSVHSNWDAVCDSDRMWPIRKIKPCRTYSSWCTECNAALFPKVVGRYPRNIIEFNEFEQAQQDKE